MSLNDAERSRTCRELQHNLELSGLTHSQAANDLGFSVQRLDDTLTLATGNDPADVWQLRDYLEQAVLDGGGEPAPFSVLTEDARSAARSWFDLRPAPRHTPS
jgi:hypothetical protein